MVKNALLIAATSLYIQAALFSGEFIASVKSREVNLNEGFALSLTLKDGTPKGSPKFNDLSNNFTLHSQHHSTNTTFSNGKVSSSIIWKITLTPKTEGSVQIPSISIETDEGVLHTKPISINVVKGTAQKPTEESDGLNIITKASNAAPYKNEPFFYTAILTSKLPLYNLQAQKMQADNAIIELVGEPKLQERVVDGMAQYVVEFTYLVTPLKAGTLTLPPMPIQGAIPQKKKKQLRSFFDDDFESFGFTAFERLKPFTLMTEEVQIDVQPPVAGVSPWLPAKSLVLEEQGSNEQTYKVGEPFSRTFIVKAEGIKASQLPHLEESTHENPNYKIYADKPEQQEQMLDGNILSTSKEQYTYIPNRAGTWVLPEISVNWWDTAKKVMKVAKIPARTVTVLPGVQTSGDQASHELVMTQQPQMGEPIDIHQTSWILYSIIGILSASLAGALFWIYTLQSKIKSLTQNPMNRAKPSPFQKEKEPKKDKKEKLPDLNPT